MRILIHGINFSPELTGIGKYSGEMAEWLAAQGHEVRVVTAPPYYPQWQLAEGYKNKWLRESPKIARLLVYRCPLWVPVKPSALKRIVHLASFALSSCPIMLAQILWKPHVVWVVEPALFCVPQAWLVACLSGGKSWLHIQDYEIDAAFDLGLLKGAFLRNTVAAGERWLMRRFDRVSTISQRMVTRALTKVVVAERVLLFPNWVDLSAFKVRHSSLPFTADVSSYRAELGIADDAIVALYSGNMGGKQGLEILAEVANLCNPKVVLVFCGQGAGRADLMALCQGLINVRFLDLQPLARLAEFLAMADLHLLPQRADAADLVMPSKLTGMLASARPVVATACLDTELADVVAGCGLVVVPENAAAFAEAINKLASSPEVRAELGASGLLYAQTHLDKASVLAKFEGELLNLINNNVMPRV